MTKILAFCDFKVYLCIVFRKIYTVMSYYKLIRKPADGEVVRGMLHKVVLTRFEERLIPVCGTIEDADRLIPALIYELGVTQSARHNRLLPVIRQVPGRTDIRIRRGSQPRHARGSILVTREAEQHLTALWRAAQRAGEEMRLEITDFNYSVNRSAHSYGK